MGKIWRLLLLALLINGSLTTAALARPVYLQDGGIIEAQRVWQEDGEVLLLLNRDSLITFSPEQIDLKKTFARTPHKAVPKKVKKAVVTAAPVATVAAAPAAAVKVPAVTAAAVKAPEKAAPASAPKTAPVVPAGSPPAKAAPAVTVSVPPPAVKADQAGKVSTPPGTPAAQTTAAPVAKKPAPRPRPVVVPESPTTASPMLAFVVLGGVLAFLLLLFASYWKVFVKAGEAGWKSLVPFYNYFVLLQIAGCPGWWFWMFFLPLVNLYFLVVMHIRLAEKFGKGPLFGVALCFLGFIFFPLLAFGPATYGEEELFDFSEEGEWKEEE